MADQHRERVTAEVVWVATIGHYDCEGRRVEHYSTSDHDTEGDARRYLVSQGLFERTEFGRTGWRDDGRWCIGGIERTLREVKDQPAATPASPLSAQGER